MENYKYNVKTLFNIYFNWGGQIYFKLYIMMSGLTYLQYIMDKPSFLTHEWWPIEARQEEYWM